MQKNLLSKPKKFAKVGITGQSAVESLVLWGIVTVS